MANPRGDGGVSYSEWLEMMRDAGGAHQKAAAGDDMELAPSSEQLETGDAGERPFARVIEDRLPPLEEDAFVALLAARKAKQDELKRDQEQIMRKEERRLTRAIKEYRRDLQRQRGVADNPSVVFDLLTFDFSKGFMPDDVTVSGYTYFEPADDDDSSMVILRTGLYGVDWAENLLSTYTIALSMSVLADPIPGEGIPLMQLARHLPSGAVIRIASDGIIEVDGAKRNSITVNTRATWEYEDAQGGYAPYADEEQANIERAYRREPRGTHSIAVFGVGVIVLNFNTMKQRNTSTASERAIRRQQDADGARLAPIRNHLVHVVIDLSKRSVCTYVNGLASASHTIPQGIPPEAFTLDPDQALFLFAHNDKARMRGGCLRWVSLQPRALTSLEVRAACDATRIFTNWSCSACTSVNDGAAMQCHVCATPRYK